MTTATTAPAVQQPQAPFDHATVLPGTPESAHTARTWVRDRLTSRQTPDSVADDAVLLLNELVANAVQWTGCKRIGIRLRMTSRRLRIDVEDGSRSLPVRLPAGPYDENGRGLNLLVAHADRWGVDVLPTGKTAWFELAIPRATARPNSTTPSRDRA
jgi:anti-sigma regulatory factor (Ser/Thr protein kinase)